MLQRFERQSSQSPTVGKCKVSPGCVCTVCGYGALQGEGRSCHTGDTCSDLITENTQYDV